jgi:hypothetical protein
MNEICQGQNCKGGLLGCQALIAQNRAENNGRDRATNPNNPTHVISALLREGRHREAQLLQKLKTLLHEACQVYLYGTPATTERLSQFLESISAQYDDFSNNRYNHHHQAHEIPMIPVDHDQQAPEEQQYQPQPQPQPQPQQEYANDIQFLRMSDIGRMHWLSVAMQTMLQTAKHLDSTHDLYINVPDHLKRSYIAVAKALDTTVRYNVPYLENDQYGMQDVDSYTEHCISNINTFMEVYDRLNNEGEITTLSFGSSTSDEDSSSMASSFTSRPSTSSNMSPESSSSSSSMYHH